MGLLNTLAEMFAEPWRPVPMQFRQEEESTEAQLARIRRETPDTPPTFREAYSVPAVFRAVNLIANTIGMLTLNVFRNGEKLDPLDRPRLVVRPDPDRTPRDFFRETAFSMAAYGEAWWWIPRRDTDQSALSLMCVPPPLISVTKEPGSRYPVIRWGQRDMPRKDMVQIVLSRVPGELRGTGPLQACGAAMSVAVESQRWAAKVYASPRPSVHLNSEPELEDDEAKELKAKYYEAIATDDVFVSSGPLTLKEFGQTDQAGELLTARLGSVGDVARAYGIPGPILEFGMEGSSIVYSNREALITALFKQCLQPDYLEPMEQAMSDLLTRSHTARFSLDDQLRADIKTRFEAWGIGIDKGFLTVNEARSREGLAPGDIENSPIPFSPPAAVVTSVPEIPASTFVSFRTIDDFRCPKCDRKLAERASEGTHIRCRCGTLAAA